MGFKLIHIKLLIHFFSIIQTFTTVVQEEIKYLVEQTKAETNQYEKIQKEIKDIVKDIEKIETEDDKILAKLDEPNQVERNKENGLKKTATKAEGSSNGLSRSVEASITVQAPFKPEYKTQHQESLTDKVIIS